MYTPSEHCPPTHTPFAFKKPKAFPSSEHTFGFPPESIPWIAIPETQITATNCFTALPFLMDSFYEYDYKNILRTYFDFFWVYTPKWNCWIIVLFLIFEEQPYHFAHWLSHFTVLQECTKIPIFPHPCTTFFNSGHPKWCEVIPHCISLMSSSDVQHLFICLFTICPF